MEHPKDSAHLLKKAARDGLSDSIPAVDHSFNDPETNMAIPSDDAVEEAKDWVDSNEK